jgi:mRNA interferase RelE/StbE
MYSVEWKKRAIKDLRKIDRAYQMQIVESVKRLESWPKCGNVKRLTNYKQEYRLRVGRYRVFFNVHEQIEIVMVEEVKKRDDRTY